MTLVVTPGSGQTIQTLDDVAKNTGASSATTVRVVEASDTPSIALVGGVTETAPASDTASSGLNGRLQRVAQRLTSLIALLPTSLGGSGGLKVESIAALAAGANNIGLVVPAPQATVNGATASRVNSAATTNATNLKGSAGNLYGIHVFNVAAYDVFLKLYTKATAPTVGTDTPVWTIPVKSGGGFSVNFPVGSPVPTGISYAITKLQADGDTTAVAAGDLTGRITWM